jgi:hypothetical protein
MGSGCCKGGKKIDFVSLALRQLAVNVRLGRPPTRHHGGDGTASDGDRRWLTATSDGRSSVPSGHRDPGRMSGGSERALPLFPTRRKPTIFSPIARLNSETCRMVGSNRVRHAADLIYGEADINNVTARERDQVPSSRPGPEIWRKHPPPERSQKATRGLPS